MPHRVLEVGNNQRVESHEQLCVLEPRFTCQLVNMGQVMPPSQGTNICISMM